MANTEQKVDYKCGHCGSTDIVFNVTGIWNAEKQQIEVEKEPFDILDSGICDKWCKECGSVLPSGSKDVVKISYEIDTCPQCTESNLNEDKTLCCDCEGQP